MPVKWLQLHAEDFGASVVCTGDQIAAVLAFVDQVAGGLSWFFADLDSVGDHSRPQQTSTAIAIDTAELLAFAGRVGQFIWGVFLGAPKHLAAPALRDPICTQDDQNPELLDALVEIRAFDTSFVELYTADIAIIDAVRSRFARGRAT